MRVSVLAIVFGLFSWGVSYAEPIPVRSGEHDRFTRVVLPIPDGAKWTLENETGTSRLIFEDHDDGFDLSSAFEIIPRTRLTALIARESELELQLACDCPVSAFSERNGFLVVDISDGPPITNETEQLISPGTLPVSSFSYGELLWFGEERLNEDARLDEVTPIQQFGEIDGMGKVEEVDEIIVQQTRDSLLEAFANAASTGLVSAKTAMIDTNFEDEPVSDELPIFDSSEVEQMSDIPPNAQVRVTDSKDVPNGNTLENMALSGAICPNPELVRVSRWGDDSEFSEQIGKSNTELFDSMGRIDREGVVRRARLYIHFGFGAEALQTLGLEPSVSSDYPELVDLANILEHGFSKNPRSLHRFSSCPSDFALWGILTAEKLPSETAINAPAALLALQALPAHLKFVVAEGLASRLLERGDIENAEIAIRSLQRLEENAANSPKMVVAKAAKLRDDDENSTSILDEIVSEDTPEAPEALTAIVAKSIEDGTVLPADLALLAETYALEFRNSERGAEMLRTSILASAKSEQFSKAFDTLKENLGGSSLTEETTFELASFAFSEFTEKANDVDFVDGFFTNFTELQSLVDPQITLEMAIRLFSIGFTENASNVISSLPIDFQSDDLRLLRAKVFLEADELSESLAEIDGLQGPEFSRLRGVVLQKMGENQQAAQNFDEALMPELATSSLWLSDNWSELMPEATPIFGSMTELSNGAPEQIEINQNMLGLTSDALADSQEARSAIRNILEELKVSE